MRPVTLVSCASVAAALLTAPACKKDAPLPVGGETAPAAPVERDTAAPAAREGVLVAPEGGHVQIRFPPSHTPTKAEQPIPTEAGELKATVWTAEGATDAFVFSVAGMPKALLAGSNATKLVRNAAAGALGGIDGVQDREEPFAPEGYPGLRVWYHGTVEGQAVSGRIDVVFVPPNLIQTIYLGSGPADVKAPEVVAFFDSFRLIGLEPYGVRVVKAADGGFEIAFPASYPEPERSEEEVDFGGIGKSKYVMYRAVTPKGVVGAGFMGMPAGVEIGKAAFDGGRDEMLKSAGATLVSEEDIVRDGRPGRRVRFRGELDGESFEGRAELVAGDDRVHVLLALMPSAEQLEDAQVNDFFGSLKLVAAPAAPPERDEAAPEAPAGD